MSKADLKQALNSVHSQSYGRRIFCIENDSGKYWIKQQLAHVNAEYERSFLNELNIYERLNYLESPDNHILCNFSISNFKDKPSISESYVSQRLCVEHAEALFQIDPIQIPFSKCIQILKISLDVLENLHELGFIHGDLKAEHFRQQQEVGFLIDFEQACHLDDVKSMPNTATPRYMAPELFHAEHKSIQSDLYALGIIWLEWLSQTRLQAKTYQDWAFLHCQTLNIGLNPKFQLLEDILKQMLSRQVQFRCSNIYQIKQVLREIS